MVRQSEPILTREEVERIKEALSTCPRDYQKLLEPLLKETIVQKLLVSFLYDTSKSFQDWVCDAQVVLRLKALQSRNSDEIHRASERYDDALQVTGMRRVVTGEMAKERGERTGDGGGSNQAPSACKQGDLLILQADAMRLEGVDCFKEKNYMKAAARFKAAADNVKDMAEIYLENAKRGDNKAAAVEEGGSLIEERDMGQRALELRLKCLCNVAISLYKAERPFDVPSVCTEALSLDAECIKALYWRGRVRLEQGMAELAAADLSSARRRDPDDEAICSAAEAASLKVRDMQASRDIAAERNKVAKQLAKEEEDELTAALDARWRETWSVELPRPPLLAEERAKNPVQVFNEYIQKSKSACQVHFEFTPPEPRVPILGFCTVDGRFSVAAQAKNTKLCKTKLSVMALRAVARIWNQCHADDEDAISMDRMVECAAEDKVPPPNQNQQSAPPRLGVEHGMGEGGRTFDDYAMSWIRLVAQDVVQKVNFVPTLLKKQRAQIHILAKEEQHRLWDELGPREGYRRKDFVSRSETLSGGQRAICVTRNRSLEAGDRVIDALVPPNLATDPQINIPDLWYLYEESLSPGHC